MITVLSWPRYADAGRAAYFRAVGSNMSTPSTSPLRRPTGRPLHRDASPLTRQGMASRPKSSSTTCSLPVIEKSWRSGNWFRHSFAEERAGDEEELRKKLERSASLNNKNGRFRGAMNKDIEKFCNRFPEQSRSKRIHRISSPFFHRNDTIKIQSDFGFLSDQQKVTKK